MHIFLLNLFFDNFGFPFEYIQFGSTFFFFIKSFIDELSVIKKIDFQFFSKRLFIFKKDVNILFPSEGFIFIDWYFRLFRDGSSFLIPSVLNYSLFLKRVKNIINNSNYGAVCLLLKFFY